MDLQKEFAYLKNDWKEVELQINKIDEFMEKK